jgi:hypothetical protein
MLFKAYFPSDSFHHLHQTTDHLLLKLFATEDYLNKVSTHLFIDQTLANQTLLYRIGRLSSNLKQGQYDNEGELKAIQNALVFAEKQGLANVPYFLK